MTTTDRDPLEDAVCFALYSCAQSTVQFYRDVLAPWGISYQQLLILTELWERGETTPSQLAQAVHLNSSAVSGLLGRMERQDLVVRKHDRVDRRTVRVSATDRSQEIRAQLRFLPQCLSVAMGLEPDQAKALVGALHTLRDTLDRAPRPAVTSREEIAS